MGITGSLVLLAIGAIAAGGQTAIGAVGSPKQTGGGSAAD